MVRMTSGWFRVNVGADRWLNTATGWLPDWSANGGVDGGSGHNFLRQHPNGSILISRIITMDPMYQECLGKIIGLYLSVCVHYPINVTRWIAERLVDQAREMLKKNNDKLQSGEVATITAAIDALEKLRASEDQTAIKAAVRNLMTKSRDWDRCTREAAFTEQRAETGAGAVGKDGAGEGVRAF